MQKLLLLLPLLAVTRCLAESSERQVYQGYRKLCQQLLPPAPSPLQLADADLALKWQRVQDVAFKDLSPHADYAVAGRRAERAFNSYMGLRSGQQQQLSQDSDDAEFERRVLKILRKYKLVGSPARHIVEALRRDKAELKRLRKLLKDVEDKEDSEYSLMDFIHDLFDW